MRMPGIAAAVALAALSGAWSGPERGQDPGAAPVPPPGPELRIAATATPDPMISGTRSVYTVTVANTGGVDAEDVTITGTLGSGTAPAAIPAGCSLDERTITCGGGGVGVAIRAGESMTYDIPVILDPSLPDGTVVTARAHVSAPRATSDSTQLTSRIRSEADVEIAAVGPAVVREDDGITYTLIVTNNGPSRAAGVTVRDPVDGATITGRPAECPGGGPAVTCSIGALDPHESRTLTVTATPDTTGSIGNCATVSTAARDEYAANNRSCTTTTVRPARAPAAPEHIHTATLAAEPPAPAKTPEAERSTPEAAASEDAAATEGDTGDVPAPDELAPSEAGTPQAHETLPMTGVSLWLVGLGVPVLIAVGLLVRYFARRERTEEIR